jgi:FkbM family methyltransferase
MPKYHLSNLVRKSPQLLKLLKKTYYYLPLFIRCKLPLGDQRTYLESFLRPLIQQKCFFVKIGAYDGMTGDPLASIIDSYGWSGLMVEPVKYIFDALAKNFSGNTSMILENAAISSENGSREFYFLRQSDDPHLPPWYNQIGSFYLEHLMKLKEFIPNLEDYLISHSVSCLTFSSLLEKHKISRVDLIHIDTEGYDYEVIKLIDFAVIRPFAILYEHLHLSPNDKEESIEYLRSFQYEILEMDSDILAYSST